MSQRLKHLIINLLCLLIKLIPALLSCKIQPSSTALVVIPLAPFADATVGSPSLHVTIATTEKKTYPATNVKIQNIFKRWDAPSISDEGVCAVSSLMPNAHIFELFLTPASDMEESSDDPRIELDCYASVVFLESNSFVFESTRRYFNDQPFNSELGMAKKILLYMEH